MKVPRLCAVLFILAALVVSGCYALRTSSGGGQTEFTPPRQVNAKDVALPDGYRIEAVATGLTFPTGVAFDHSGAVHVVESGYSYGEVWTVPRLLKVGTDGRSHTVVAEGGRNGPWTGVVHANGRFYIAEGGVLEGGRILRVEPDGNVAALVEGLPSYGDHHTNGPAAGPDGWVYFGQGTATNSGVVGEDNLKFGWLKRRPEFHDVACRDVIATGESYESRNVLRSESDEKVKTGPFSPFGRERKKGDTIQGRIPCSGSIMRVNPESKALELVAWGLRNPFGLAFSPEGKLYATENQFDERGSRPVFGAGDLLWEIRTGGWYGWPDYHAGEEIFSGDRYASPGKPRPKRLISPPSTPEKPVVVFGVHSSSNGFDFSRNHAFGYPGQAFVAQLGDEAPTTGKVLAPVGFKVVRVDIRSGVVHDFAVNRGKGNGPASFLGSGGLERPVAARFDPTGTALYVVDFGVMMQDKTGAKPVKETGVLWKIHRDGR